MNRETVHGKTAGPLGTSKGSRVTERMDMRNIFLTNTTRRQGVKLWCRVFVTTLAEWCGVNPVPRLNSRGLGEEPLGITTPFLPAFTPFQLVGTWFTGGASPWYGVNALILQPHAILSPAACALRLNRLNTRQACRHD